MMQGLKHWLSLGILAISGTLLTGTLLNSNLQARASTCTALPVIGDDGTEGTIVKKTVSPPDASVAFRSNWNTDFAVEPTTRYNSYVSTITAADEGKYTIKMNLKYSDDTADEVYSETVSLTPGKPFNIKVIPKRNGTPYQVNLYVGEIEAVGKTYQLSASRCR